MRSIEDDMGDIDLEVLILIGLTCIAFQCERFPLGMEGVLAVKLVKG